jgi:hypothetical protein
MAPLVLAAPTVPIGSLSGSGGGPNVATPNLLPAAENALTGFTGFSFPNNGAVILRVVVGVAGAGTLTFTVQRTVEGQLPAALTYTLVNSTAPLFGPFSPGDFNDVNGLFQATMSVVTGNSVGVYQLPTSRFGLVT